MKLNRISAVPVLADKADRNHAKLGTNPTVANDSLGGGARESTMLPATVLVTRQDSRGGGKLTQQELNTLATYNAEVMRGIEHKEYWKREMALLQRLFDDFGYTLQNETLGADRDR